MVQHPEWTLHVEGLGEIRGYGGIRLDYIPKGFEDVFRVDGEKGRLQVILLREDLIDHDRI